MATESARLNLNIFSTSDIVSAEDVAENFSIIDSYIGFAQVSSLTDISNPFEGLKAMLPTGATYIYIDGDGWVAIGVATVDGAKGKKADLVITSDSTAIGLTEAMSNIKIVFTAEVGRRYWIEYCGQFIINGDNANIAGVDVNMRWASGSSVSLTDPQLSNGDIYRVRRLYMETVSVLEPIAAYFVGELVPNIAGNVAVGLSYRNIFDTGNVYVRATSTSPAYMIVRDVGPA